MTIQVDEDVLPQGQPASQLAFRRLQQVVLNEKSPATAVSTRFVDFWLLGGASIVLWVVMSIGQVFRDSTESIESHFMQVGSVFSMMSIFCNHPHFMISYRFGYGRGKKFIFQHWFSLLFVPIGLIALYALAYFNFECQLSELPWVSAVNHAFEWVGSEFRLGTLDNLGTEILSLSVMLMNLTVGWHYSKQVFGCMMVYAHYDKYPLSSFQRKVIKAGLFSVAFLNFFYLSVYATDYYSSNPLGRAHFFNIPLIPLGFPRIIYPITAGITGVIAVATVICVFYTNYRRYGKRPSVNLLVPWVAFYVWWVQLYRLPEYYFAAVPFFHSLQYLPFAYRLEGPQLEKSRWPAIKKSIFLAVLLFVGFCGFELVPSLLDRALETSWYLKTWFFTIAFAVFINVHHFFIDSVVWKFSQCEVKENLLGEG